MSPLAAEVIRVVKKNRKFGVLYPHSTNRFLASDGNWQYASADEEDKAWQNYGWGFTDSSGRIVKGVLLFTNLIRMKKVPENTPIPGSTRWKRQQSGIQRPVTVY